MTVLHALHGFLGKPTDWNGFGPNCISHDILSISTPNMQNGLWEWAKLFNAKAEVSTSPRILMGYSLGGRLAMHALLLQPDLWQGAVIISAHPGLSNEEDRQTRMQSDRVWAERFESEQWDFVLKDFYKNDIFANAVAPFERYEKDYNRRVLADIFRYWSLSAQQDLTKQIAELEVPILWVAGEKDSRYAAQARSLRLNHRNSQKWIASHAGHRVPWECTDEFKLRLKNFVEQC